MAQHHDAFVTGTAAFIKSGADKLRTDAATLMFRLHGHRGKAEGRDVDHAIMEASRG